MSNHDLIKNDSLSLPSTFIGTTGRGTPTFDPPDQITPNSSLNEILAFARKENVSDVHMTADKPITFRQFGKFKNATTEKISAAQIDTLITANLPKNMMAHFETTGDVEYVHTIVGYGRFRMTIIKQRNGSDITARVIPMEIPKFAETGMTDACINLTKWAQGLVLIAGPTGCGKTTTLAVLVEMLNQSRPEHIITIEQPIEIVYEPKKCQITQREIGMHTLTQDNALRAALREDPDILVVSELRDLSTIQLAVSASETGHLVLGTMNTVNAAQTISKLVDSFPADEQTVMRKMISESLRGIICQQLIPKVGGTGLVPAYEILIVNQSVANLIREDKIMQINNVISTGKTFGMKLMDTSLEELLSKKLISIDDAMERATNPNNLQKEMTIL
ncbi:MAG: PilT/PilU family type 4a pilus ATPase [Candidatus Omnitrophica bacterium]|nr:PilT/PilU family type 4a pilus ATPase [Candidatus Omnitrophota bacterium]